MITTIQGVVYTASKGIKRFLSKKAELYAFRKFNRTYVLTEDDYTALSLEGIDVLCQNSPGFGCDINRFNRENYSSTEIENIKNKLNIPKTHHVLIYIGRLVAFKGINVALKAFIELNKINNDVTFVVCGDFDKIHSSGLSDSEKNILMHHANIRYVGFTDKISDYLAIADLNIFPSIREGLPVNLMESLAMSVPVITNNARGCRDIVEDGINGYVLKSRHYTEYMKKISTLIKDQMKLNQLKINCTLSRQRFDRINYIIEYDNLYKQIVNM